MGSRGFSVWPDGKDHEQECPRTVSSPQNAPPPPPELGLYVRYMHTCVYVTCVYTGTCVCVVGITHLYCYTAVCSHGSGILHVKWHHCIYALL